MDKVAVKSEDQQAILMAHRVRSRSVATRTALVNQIHGHLQEFGIVVSKGRHKLKRELADIFDLPELPPLLYDLLHNLLSTLYREEERIEALDKRISHWVSNHAVARRLTELDGRSLPRPWLPQQAMPVRLEMVGNLLSG